MQVSMRKWHALEGETFHCLSLLMMPPRADFFSGPREEGAQDALQLCDQRSAIGIVLNGTQVLETVAGSPAHSCGMIDPLDELLMVDGQKVTAQTVTAALLGSDSSVLVVSLVLRKSGSRSCLLSICALLRFRTYALNMLTVSHVLDPGASWSKSTFRECLLIW